jgi:hypothetical protein
MKRLAKNTLILLATVMLSSTAFAAIDYSDDFESYTLNTGGNLGDLGGGWNGFANVFTGFPACDPYLYNYGPFPTPNSDSAFSSIVLGNTGQAINVFSDYNNGDHANGNCIETSVFQERAFSAADAGSYEFKFDAEVPAPLGADVNTYAFIKLLDPNNGYAAVLFETVSTVTAGSKSISVDLDATADGQILQWGFSTVSSNYLASGRFYDNVTFAPAGVVGPPVEPLYKGVPIPLWAYLIMAGLLAGVGVSRIRSRT